VRFPSRLLFSSFSTSEFRPKGFFSRSKQLGRIPFYLVAFGTTSRPLPEVFLPQPPSTNEKPWCVPTNPLEFSFQGLCLSSSAKYLNRIYPAQGFKTMVLDDECQMRDYLSPSLPGWHLRSFSVSFLSDPSCCFFFRPSVPTMSFLTLCSIGPPIQLSSFRGNGRNPPPVWLLPARLSPSLLPAPPFSHSTTLFFKMIDNCLPPPPVPPQDWPSLPKQQPLGSHQTSEFCIRVVGFLIESFFSPGGNRDRPPPTMAEFSARA